MMISPTPTKKTAAHGSDVRHRPRIVCLCGPTAVGKTALLERLAKSAHGREPHAEVVVCDALQIYRSLHIGVAKPPRTLTERLPHWLMSICDPDEQFNAGRFVTMADEVCDAIQMRHRIPLLVGGTPFYLRNFIYGLPSTPPSQPEIREKLLHRLEQEGGESLYRELAEHDAPSAARIAPRDTTRIIRALEVYYISGRPLSTFAVPKDPRNRYRFTIIGLHRDRTELKERIHARVAQMAHMGLVQEVLTLVRQGYNGESPAMQAIGYREFFAPFGGPFPIDISPSQVPPTLPSAAIDQILEAIATHTIQYTKQQMTFFRKLPAIDWYYPDEADTLDRIRAAIAPE